MGRQLRYHYTIEKRAHSTWGESPGRRFMADQVTLLIARNNTVTIRFQPPRDLANESELGE
jgi:hypothetical protein